MGGREWQCSAAGYLVKLSTCPSAFSRSSVLVFVRREMSLLVQRLRQALGASQSPTVDPDVPHHRHLFPLLPLHRRNPRPTILPSPPSRHLQLPSRRTATHSTLRRARHRRLKRTNGDPHPQSATDCLAGPAAATAKPNVQSVASDCNKRPGKRVHTRRNACGERSLPQRPLFRQPYDLFCVKKTACLGRRAVPYTSSQVRIHTPCWFTAARRSRSMYTDCHSSSEHRRASCS